MGLSKKSFVSLRVFPACHIRQPMVVGRFEHLCDTNIKSYYTEVHEEAAKNHKDFVQLSYLKN